MQKDSKTIRIIEDYEYNDDQEEPKKQPKKPRRKNRGNQTSSSEEEQGRKGIQQKNKVEATIKMMEDYNYADEPNKKPQQPNKRRKNRGNQSSSSEEEQGRKSTKSVKRRKNRGNQSSSSDEQQGRKSAQSQKQPQKTVKIMENYGYNDNNEEFKEQPGKIRNNRGNDSSSSEEEQGRKKFQDKKKDEQTLKIMEDYDFIEKPSHKPKQPVMQKNEQTLKIIEPYGYNDQPRRQRKNGNDSSDSDSDDDQQNRLPVHSQKYELQLHLVQCKSMGAFQQDYAKIKINDQSYPQYRCNGNQTLTFGRKKQNESKAVEFPNRHQSISGKMYQVSKQNGVFWLQQLASPSYAVFMQLTRKKVLLQPGMVIYAGNSAYQFIKVESIRLPKNQTYDTSQLQKIVYGNQINMASRIKGYKKCSNHVNKQINQQAEYSPKQKAKIQFWNSVPQGEEIYKYRYSSTKDIKIPIVHDDTRSYDNPSKTEKFWQVDMSHKKNINHWGYLCYNVGLGWTIEATEESELSSFGLRICIQNYDQLMNQEASDKVLLQNGMRFGFGGTDLTCVFQVEVPK